MDCNSTTPLPRGASPDPGLPSCQGCRKRKLKCSRRKPACDSCERLGTECIYESRRNKPGLKSGAVEALNQRLQVVEKALFNQQSSALEYANPTPASLVPDHPSSGNTQHGYAPIVDVLSTLAQELRSLNSNIVISHNQRVRSTDQVNTLPNALKRRRLETEADENRSEAEITNNVTGTFLDDVLTDKTLLNDLLDVYSHTVQPWIPILHMPTFRLRLQDHEERLRSRVIIHSIVVASLRYLRREGEFLPPALVKYETERARRLVLLTAMDGLTIENLQALIIIAYNDIGNGDSHKTWPIIGSLTRSAQYLQLSIETERRQRRGSFLGPLPTLPAPSGWVEDEGRRRVFWNIFILDRCVSLYDDSLIAHAEKRGYRFCSTVTGWNVSLTAADVCRRLPVCGGRWYNDQPAATPYFGIWDRSTAKMGNAISFLPARYQTAPRFDKGSNPAASRGWDDPDMAATGALAYYIETMESLSRVTTHFLDQEVNFDDRQELSNWLTRFKELDLHLVHWKMQLPQQWKDSGISRKTMPGVMDPNMTVANATHNISLILLHQPIAYPSPDLEGIKLPSAYSAETCHSAAIETATITKRYLDGKDGPVAPQFAFCAFVSAKVLLTHWRYYDSELSPEFWIFVEALEEMSKRWTAGGGTDLDHHHTIFFTFAQRLRDIYDKCQRDPKYCAGVPEPSIDFQVNEMASCNPSIQQSERTNSESGLLGAQIIPPSRFRSTLMRSDQEMSASARPLRAFSEHTKGLGDAALWSAGGGSGIAVPDVEGDELAAISQVLMDQNFRDMDRIVSFDDMMFGGITEEPGTWQLN